MKHTESNFTKLQAEITVLSNSQDWHEAKLEWQLKEIYQENERECLCGHNPIKNICVLKNKYNGNFAEVGNICVKNFLGITSATDIFNAVNRCHKDITKSMGPHAFHYMKDHCKLTEWEIKFYSNTLRKRNLSTKQENYRIQINQKFLDFTIRQTDSPKPDQYAEYDLYLEQLKTKLNKKL